MLLCSHVPLTSLVKMTIRSVEIIVQAWKKDAVSRRLSVERSAEQSVGASKRTIVYMGSRTDMCLLTTMGHRTLSLHGAARSTRIAHDPSLRSVDCLSLFSHSISGCLLPRSPATLSKTQLLLL